MSSIAAVPSSSRTTHSMVAMGTLIAAAVSVYIVHRTHRRRRLSGFENDDGTHQTGKQNDNAGDNTDAESSRNFYEKLGVAETDLPMHVKREIHKERKRQERALSISRTTPMYDNILMRNKDGNPMCCVSMKKARWYVKKEIAEWSSLEDVEGREQSSECSHSNGGGAAAGATAGDTRCIRLLFEHNRAEPESYEETSDTHFARYLRIAKKNVCVSCGDGGRHMRHYILPHSYRTLLPEEYKKHMSHDVVILCPECHVRCERRAQRRRHALEDGLRTQRRGEGAPDAPPTLDDPRLGRVKSCAIALVRRTGDVLTDKQEEYEREVRAYLASACDDAEEREALLDGTEALSKAQLQAACSVRYRVKNPDFVPGPVIVVESLKSEEDIDEFIIDWRKHFVDTAKPQFMPTGWRVENPVICRLGQGANVKSW